ncbi:hypothetical protein Tco_1084613 [Tanacetum coccineum]
MAWLDYDEHVDSQSMMDNEVGVTSPKSTTQTLPSFEEYISPVTYSEEVEKTLGTPIEVEPLNETKLEEVGLNCNHNTPLSSGEVPSFDGPEPQPLLNSPSLDLSLGNVIGSKPPIKPHSLDSSRMKVVDYLTTQTPPSPHRASSNPKDTYCYYRPCIDDPKKHYGFKPGLLGQSGSLGVDFSNIEMIEVDWELESKEVYFLGRGLNSPVRPKEVENKWDKIAALPEVTFKECVQCMETASGFVVTPSELTSDSVKAFVMASKCNRLNETLEDSAKRRVPPRAKVNQGLSVSNSRSEILNSKLL